MTEIHIKKKCTSYLFILRKETDLNFKENDNFLTGHNNPTPWGNYGPENLFTLC